MKWHGVIGFASQSEDAESPSIYRTTIVEREYVGETFNRTISYHTGESTSVDLTYGQSLSILADPYLLDFYSTIVYAIIDGVKWNISKVSVEYPRIKLDIGGVYKDDTRGARSNSSGFTYGV